MTEPTTESDLTADVEVVPCPVCGSAQASPWLAGPDRSLPLPGWFQLVRCDNCGVVYQNPRPTARRLSGYYPDDYQPYAARQHASWGERVGWQYGYELYRRCRFVRRHAAGGDLLDVGCATGTFLNAIRDFGTWRVWGIEPGLGAARHAHARGLSVVVALFEDVRLPAASLDAVTLWDVLEHLGDPVASLTRIGAALRPDGHVFLNVPTLDSWDAHLFGRYWCGLDLPRHLTLFDRATLTQALEAAGLQVVTMGHPTGNHYSATQSTRQVLAEWLAPGRLQQALTRATFGPAARLALAPYGLAAELLHHGASLTVAARRR